MPKAGTTWLHRTLAGHPQVFVPERKEIHYFDRWYDRGDVWYQHVFRHAIGRPYRRIGEITPHYLYGEMCADRIRAMSSVNRLIVMLRDPVERAHSHYWFRVRVDNYRRSFEEFLDQRPEAISWGMYASHLSRFYQSFERHEILPLIYESVIASHQEAVDRLTVFLGVDSWQLSDEATATVNSRFMPRHRRAYALAASAGRLLHKFDADRVLRIAKRSRAFRALQRSSSTGTTDALTPMLVERLSTRFRSDVSDLEQLIETDLSLWRESWDRRITGDRQPT